MFFIVRFSFLLYFRLSSWRAGAQPVDPPPLHMHYLAHDLCQSRLDGRNGSSACTVIAVKVCMAILAGTLPLPPYDREQPQCVDSFVQCMREGNRLYDECPASATGELLGVFDAVNLIPDAGVQVRKELGCRNKPDCTRVLKSVADEAVADGQMRAGVLVQNPLSLAIVVLPDSTFVLFDSHSHGEKGALVLYSVGKCCWEAAAAHLEQIVGEMRDSHLCFLRLP